MCYVCRFSLKLFGWFSFMLCKKKRKEWEREKKESVLLQWLCRCESTSATLHTTLELLYRNATLSARFRSLLFPSGRFSPTPVSILLSYLSVTAYVFFCLSASFFARNFTCSSSLKSLNSKLPTTSLARCSHEQHFKHIEIILLGQNISSTLLSSRLSSFFNFF